MDDLYHQEILEHYKHPHNYGKIANPDYEIDETNASCGDSFTYYVKSTPPVVPPLAKGGLEGVLIADLKFTGVGCAISTAASSILVEFLIGKPVSILKTLDEASMCTLLGIENISSARRKCLMLPVKALSKITL